MPRKIDHARKPHRRTLASIVNGRSVAVVGSGIPERNMSAEIDACDIVIRFNHFYNLESGRVGRKTDIVVITPCAAWSKLSPMQKRADVIAAEKPLIMAVRYPERLLAADVQQFFADCELLEDSDTPFEIQRFTTGTITLAKLAEHAENCTVLAVGFSRGEAFQAYLEKDGRHYLDNAATEANAREKYLSILATKRIFEPRGLAPEIRVVIPARKGSSLKDKNIRPWKDGKPLLVRAVETAREAFPDLPPPVVLTDSERYAEIAKSAGAEIPYIDDSVSDDEDIVVRLRRWRDRTNFRGFIVMVQCTSPETSPETLRKFRAEANRCGLRAHTAAISAVREKFKSTAYFVAPADGGDAEHLFRRISPSVPRQRIPAAWRFTGGVSLVHADALDEAVLFPDADFRIVPVPETEAVDIDREEDFKT